MKTELYNQLSARVGLSLLPVPVYRMESISRLTGSNIWVMRDDLTGFAFGGNKTRKLDYLVANLVASGADSIVTFGSNQSNWCRMTAAAGAAVGLEVFLLLDGTEPGTLTGNLILDKLTGANIEYLGNDDHDFVVARATEKVESLRTGGRNPYYMPVGGSTPVGTLGYINAFNEIMAFSERSGVRFNRIFVATGSAGTQAGLVAGAIVAGWDGEVTGISVGRERVEQSLMVATLVSDTFERYGYSCPVSEIERRTIVDDSYAGEGYRKNTRAAGEAIELFARREGIFLDEVYTGKAASGVLDYARSGRNGKENVLFIHTGGAVQLFE